MNENVVGFLILLIGAMLCALVWLFTEMHDMKKRVKELESDMRQSWDSQDIIRRRVSRAEDDIQKLNIRFDEKREVSENG